MDEIQILARHVKETSFEILPDDAVHFSRIAVMDLLGVAIAGSSAPGCGTVVDQLRVWGGSPTSTILAYDLRLPSIHAAFANSVFAHALDYDDTHELTGLHATASIVPATLAVAQEVGGISGKRFMTAIAVGVEVAVRLALSLRTNMHNGWLPATIFGGFGAVASVAKVLNLGIEKISDAFGILYSQTSGNRQALLDGALNKRMQPAFASMQAVYAAFYAKSGISGARNVVSGKYGLAELYAGGVIRREEISKDLGKRFEICNLSLKTYPCCRGAHPSIEAVMRICRREKIGPNDISKVEIAVPPLSFELAGRPFQIRHNPQVDAQFSIPYTVAVAITRKSVGLADFQKEIILADTAVHGLAAKVEVKPDAQLRKDDPTSPLAVVHVYSKSGRRFDENVRTLRGDPQNPLTVEECVRKFRDCVDFSHKKFPQDQVEEVIARLLHLEDVQDIGDICDYLK